MAIILLLISLCLPKGSIDNYVINTFTKQLCSDLRYVRRRNMLEDNSTYIVYIRENGDSGYAIKQEGEFIKSVLLPKNATIRDNINNSSIKFDKYGAPYPNGGTITVQSDKISKELTIVPVSGRVLLKEGQYEK